MAIEDLDQLIQACYRGPLEESLWQSFLQQLQISFDAKFATLLIRPPREGDVGISLNAEVLSNEVYDAYQENYSAQDLFINLPLGKAFTVDELVDIKELKTTEFYTHYLQPVGVEYIIGVDVEDDKGNSARLRLSRGKESNNFDQQDREQLEQLAPHLAQSIVLYSRMVHSEAKAKTYQDAFDQMEMGCLILDQNLCVISQNSAAENLLHEKQGLLLKQNKLVVGSCDENRQFKALVDGLIEQQVQQDNSDVQAFRIDLPHSLTGLGLLCRVLPRAATPDAGPAVVIFISDPEKPRLGRTEILEQLFGLTLSEARLALLLANGLSLDEASKELGVTRNTAKSHLSSVFSKTGVTRQPSLVQLILRSVASIG